MSAALAGRCRYVNNYNCTDYVDSDGDVEMWEKAHLVFALLSQSSLILRPGFSSLSGWFSIGSWPHLFLTSTTRWTTNCWGFFHHIIMIFKKKITSGLSVTRTTLQRSAEQWSRLCPVMMLFLPMRFWWWDLELLCPCLPRCSNDGFITMSICPTHHNQSQPSTIWLKISGFDFGHASRRLCLCERLAHCKHRRCARHCVRW